MTQPTFIRWTLATAAVAWCAALFVAASIAGRPAPSVFAYLVSAATYAIGALICHQRPERSFQLWGAQLPVCARCVGIYMGAAIAAIASLTTPRDRQTRTDRVRWMLAVASLPTLLTLIWEWTTGTMPTNAVRAAAGLPLGAAVMWVLVAVATSRASVEVH